jgi:hypothetical protein
MEMGIDDQPRAVSIVSKWKLLTSHGLAMLCIANDPDVRLREIAAYLGNTERHAFSVVSDLTNSGYLVKEKRGRRVRYHIQDDVYLPRTLPQERAISALFGALTRKNDVVPAKDAPGRARSSDR